MQNNVHILDDEEYTKLLNTEPNVFLQQRVQELEEELDKYKIYKSSMEQEAKELASKLEEDFTFVHTESPFGVVGDTLHISSDKYFATLYNNLAKDFEHTQLKASDADALLVLENIAKAFNLKPQFNTISELKKYRVSLDKANLYKPIKVKGVVQLKEVNDNE